MPRLTDRAQVRVRLERDRPWAAYALGDLSPDLAPNCEWWASDESGNTGDADAIVLAYRGFDPPIVFALGSAEALQPLFEEAFQSTATHEVSLQVKPATLVSLATCFSEIATTPMWRMVIDPRRFEPADETGVEVLGANDVEAIRRLYDDGAVRGESPDFFFPGMVDQGSFRGIREGHELVAVAGTHLIAPDLDVCAIGNVYTRCDRRGLGLSSRVTSAVVSDALRRGVGTVVLNVRQANDRARRVYERLGFHRHCEFVEGRARRP